MFHEHYRHKTGTIIIGAMKTHTPLFERLMVYLTSNHLHIKYLLTLLPEFLDKVFYDMHRADV